MRIKISKYRESLALMGFGALAGFINGLLGAGGGIIVVFALNKLMGRELTKKNAVFAHALCVMLPLSILSCAMYALSGNVSLEGFEMFVLPAALGGLLGGLLLGKLNTRLMKRAFALLVMLSGALLIVR